MWSCCEGIARGAGPRDLKERSSLGAWAMCGGLVSSVGRTAAVCRIVAGQCRFVGWGVAALGWHGHHADVGMYCGRPATPLAHSVLGAVAQAVTIWHFVLHYRGHKGRGPPVTA